MADEPTAPSGGFPQGAEQILEAQVGLLCALIPGATPELAASALEASYNLERDLVKVYEDLFEGKDPMWALQLHRRNKDGPSLTFPAPKQLAGNLAVPDLASWGLIVGFVTSPLLRAAYLLTGWTFTIGPYKKAEKPLIIT